MPQSFHEILITAIEDKGFTLGKLADLSRVPERYIEMMVRRHYSSLPSSPYLHGYIVRLGYALDIDGEALWQIFKNEHRAKSSGRDDHLPLNRFTMPVGNYLKWYIVLAIILIISLYVGFRFNDLFGRPRLTVIDPPTDSLVVNDHFYTIKGNTDPDNKVSINNDEISVNSDGFFSENVLLETGINTFEIKASKFLGKETISLKQIILETDESELNPDDLSFPDDHNATSTYQNNSTTTIDILPEFDTSL